ncbi:MAG: YchJ family metal-binding protein [Dokdonella sp.]|uniref:YchJ family protein n=1 Tax=Dokdonella sp. TaxID=2291710 RepID=UPI002CC3A9CC|nr:YchJ family metal-binding protein [Dokdonella sp.]HOX72569.1 YchJ family metal-binding protein [Dokdonella sp.]HPN78531.1 YchJ family metal-binding protein [Dokdonella sp.]
MKPIAVDSCPCGSGLAYATCCGRWHRGESAPDAEALMRSRYVAYVRGLEDYLLATWHASTRPACLDPAGSGAAQPTWLGLSVKKHRVESEDRAEVEFIARYRIGGGRAMRLHERSRFVREGRRWFYLDGIADPVQ